MSNILLIIQFVLVVIICACVLMQKSSNMGLGAYSGSNESLFGAKGPAGFLAKFTFIIAVLFVINTIALGYSYNKATQNTIFDKSPATNTILPKVIKKDTADIEKITTTQDVENKDEQDTQKDENSSKETIAQ